MHDVTPIDFVRRRRLPQRVYSLHLSGGRPYRLFLANVFIGSVAHGIEQDADATTTISNGENE